VRHLNRAIQGSELTLVLAHVLQAQLNNQRRAAVLLAELLSRMQQRRTLTGEPHTPAA
jgi:hypothetical protein